MKRSAILLLVVGSLAFVSAPLSHTGSSRFAAVFFDVGQGDSTLLKTVSGQTVLVDAGPPSGGIFEQLRAEGVSRIDLLILTHPQLDHYGGAFELVGRLPVSSLLATKRPRGHSDYAQLLSVLGRRGAKIITPRAGQELVLERLKLTVLNPQAEAMDSQDPNSDAVVLHARYVSLDLFLPADVESAEWPTEKLSDVDILKVAHHGSSDAGLDSALKRLSPELAVISAGSNNPFGHPAPDVLRSLASAGSTTLRTDRDGSITVSYRSGQLEVEKGR